MKASFEAPFDSQFNSLPVDSAALAYSAQDGIALGARSCVVNRTHRVVRERATAMQARRSRVRSLMVPLAICSAFLILGAVALWSGLYQYQAAEAAGAVQADVTALATNDANNQFLVVLLWFVPVSLALLATILYRRRSHGTEREMPR
jgi:hypothetical protein